MNDFRRDRNDRNSHSRSGNSGGFGGRNNFGGGQRRFNNGPREMHKATCAECGNECEVPFKPTEGKPVYCRTCFANHKPQRF